MRRHSSRPGMPVSQMTRKSPGYYESRNKQRIREHIKEYGLDNANAYEEYVSSLRRPSEEYKNTLKESTEALYAEGKARYPELTMAKLDVNTSPGRNIAIGELGTFQEYVDKYNAEHGTNVPIDAYTFKGRAPTDEEHRKTGELRKEWNDQLTQIVEHINNTYFPSPPPTPPQPSTRFLSIEEFVKSRDPARIALNLAKVEEENKIFKEMTEEYVNKNIDKNFEDYYRKHTKTSDLPGTRARLQHEWLRKSQELSRAFQQYRRNPEVQAEIKTRLPQRMAESPMRWLENGNGRKLRRKRTRKEKKRRSIKKTMKRRH